MSSFFGYDAGGIASANMTVAISSGGSALSRLDLRIENTSPTRVNDDSGANTPGITLFGFFT